MSGRIGVGPHAAIGATAGQDDRAHLADGATGGRGERRRAASSRCSVSDFRRRLRYRFDNILSRGTWAVLLWLGIATLAVIAASSLLLTVFNVTLSGSSSGSWLEDFWQSTLRTLDAGTMAGDVGWGRRILALIVTLFGILIAGTLIGIIASGVEQRIEAMQRGRSGVVETNHVVILGASAQLPDLVEQLALAGQHRRSNVIVVLADRTPAELSHEVRSFTPDLFGTRLVFRWGDRTNVGDLEIVALHDARAVIVLADDEGDADVVRTVLAVDVALAGHRVPIVAEVADPAVGESLVRACGADVHPITTDHATARLATYAFRGPHLIRVIQQLLDFRGPDLYVRAPGELTGRTFGDSVFAFQNARPIGVMDAADAVVFAPDPSTMLDADHRLVLIADDDRDPLPTRASVDPSPARPGAANPLSIDEQPAHHVLVIGWNALAGELLQQLDAAAAPGSTVTVVYDSRLVDEEPDAAMCQNLALTVLPAATANLRLEREHADPGRLTSILLVAYRHGLTPAQSDSRTLLNLRAIRRELADLGIAPSVLIELRDASNADLAAPIGPDDFVVSDAIASSMLAQLAEQPERRAVLLRLYGARRPGIGTIDPAALDLVSEVEFHVIAQRAYAAGFIAIGWSVAMERGGDVVLNPDATALVHLERGDRIVVIG